MVRNIRCFYPCLLSRGETEPDVFRGPFELPIDRVAGSEKILGVEPQKGEVWGVGDLN